MGREVLRSLHPAFPRVNILPNYTVMCKTASVETHAFNLST